MVPALDPARRRDPPTSPTAGSTSSTSFSEEDRWLVVERGDVTVVCNFADVASSVPIDRTQPANILLTSADAVRIDEGAVTLPPNFVAILDPRRRTRCQRRTRFNSGLKPLGAVRKQCLESGGRLRDAKRPGVVIVFAASLAATRHR